MRLASLAAAPPLDKPRQDLHRFAQAHVVGQAAAQSELSEERQPAEPFLLVVPQLAAEAGRRFARLDPLE